jgi:TetR/AcrR family fatty acid metabolism transcriptional regulator
MQMKSRNNRQARAPSLPRKKGRRPGAPRRSGKRAENKERIRKQILQAALELFSTKGLFRTTAKEITDKARIAEGTLFNYFKSKEDVALYFFEEELERLIEWYRNNGALHKRPLSEKLFAIIHRHLERLGPYEDFIGAVYLRAFQPASKLSPLRLETRARNLRYLRFINEVIKDSETEGLMRNLGDLTAYGFGLFHFAMITYWLHDSSRGKERTLALLDRSLKIGDSLLHIADSFLKKGAWKW